MRSYIVTNKKSIIVYLILLSYVSLLLLQRLKNSMGYFSIVEIVTFLFAILGFTWVLFLIINYLLSDKFFAITVTILLSYLFFNGHLIYLFFEQKLNSYEYFSSQIINRFSLITFIFVLLIVIIASAYKIFARFRRRIIQSFILFIGLSLIVEVFLAFKAKTFMVAKTPVLKTEFTSKSINFPNIYYIIFDSYTSPESLNRYFNYSDERFMNYLKHEKFNCSLTSHSNYASTPFCMASYLNLRWEKLPSMNQKENLYACLSSIRNNSVVSFLRSKNYQIKNFSLFKIENEANSYVFFPEVSIWGNSLPFLLYRIARKLINPIPILSNNFAVINELVSQTKVNTSDRTFTYAHLMTPHSPYILDSLGSLQKEDETPDKMKYLSQLKYTNKIMIYLITSIVSNDPTAVIIIQGDHGYRGLDNFVDKRNEAHTLFNIMYIGGNKIPNETLKYLDNPINNFRIVFNMYFGMKLELLKN